jgi:hypothetical protein
MRDADGNTGDDDGPEQAAPPGKALRLFDNVLTVAQVLLVVGSVLLLLIAYPVLNGHGTLTLDAEADTPHTVEFADGTAVESGGGSTAWIGFPEGEERRHLSDAPTVLVRYTLADDDRDARAVVLAAIGVWVGLGWIGLVNARAIVRSSRQGRPFDPDNVRRLRRIGVAVVAFPVVSWAIRWGLDRTLDVGSPVHVRMAGPTSWVYLVAGLGLLALAEVFREGSRLRALDEATI